MERLTTEMNDKKNVFGIYQLKLDFQTGSQHFHLPNLDLNYQL